MGNVNPKASPQDVNIPPFLSAGGVTPEQQSLASYSYGEDLLGAIAPYSNEGLGQSTMPTQAAEGARNKEALNLGQMSDVNQGAQYNLYQNDVRAQEQQLQNQVTLDAANSASLTSLAKGLGGLLGGSGSSSTGG